jgi:excisionase family DNA binding protein
MTNETYLSVAQAADLLGISQETLYKEIQDGNLTATESQDHKRKHKVIALSELTRLYGNIYIPDGYLEYSGEKSVDFVRIALRQENQRLRKALQETQRREQNLNDQLQASLQNYKNLIDTHADLTKIIDNLTNVLDKMT